jgi:exonuclease SbcC
MFNTTDRGSISNLHVINSRKGHCKSSAVISKRGKHYKIERQSIKKESRAGKLSVSTQLNLFEVDVSGNIVRDLCGEQRRETEKTLKNIVGNSDDFLLTSFASQGEMNSFINQKASARKTVLSKFLDLDVFDQLNEAAKQEASVVKQMIRNVPERDYDLTIVETKNKLKIKTNERDHLYETLETLRQRVRSLDLNLETRDDKKIVTKQDVHEQETRVKSLLNKKEIVSKKLEGLSETKKEITSKTSKMQEIKDSFPLEELKKTLEEQKELDNTTIKTRHKLDKEKQKLKLFEKEAEKLEDIPCSEACPVNKYMEGALKAKKKLKGQNKIIEEVAEDLKLTRIQLKKLKDKDLENKLSKYNELVSNFGDLSMEKNHISLKIVDSENTLEKTRISIEEEVKSLDEMKVNVSSDDSAEQVSAMRRKLRDLRTKENSLEDKVSKSSEDIGLLQARIEKLTEERDAYEELIEKWRGYELFMQATSKNGLPLEIIRSRLPEINAEIASILQGVTGFTVELESNEGSNDMDIYINYGDSKRIIECCSGMEKMMSAMAIRVALTNVSELSKSDLFIIDEGFGALDDGNIEACSRFLESLKKWFRCILIISHVDAVKDSVDNVLEISKDGKDAIVRQE